MSLLEIQNVTVSFPLEDGRHVHALTDVSLSIESNEIVGLVGESGCGKTTLGRVCTVLVRPAAGEVLLAGVSLTELRGRDLRAMRPDIQMVFQDPYASLDPRMTIQSTLAEAIQVRHSLRGSALRRRLFELLHDVGLAPEHAGKYPHEFSGGQRQRIAIARALAAEPKLIVADEPVSALDVSIQSRIINLLRRLCGQHGLTMLLISHDLAVVHHLAERIAVMYLGRLVELGPAEALMSSPRHPYTQALISAIPEPDPDLEARRRGIVLKGEPPSPISPPPGCPFHPRCPWAEERCRAVLPTLRPMGQHDHLVACGRAAEIARQGGRT